MLVSQLRLHLQLERHGQCRMGIGVRGVQLQRILQRHLGTLGIALLDVGDAELHIGIACFVTPFRRTHGVDIARGHATTEQTGNEQ